MVSDRAGQIGPLDKAAFGWVVVLPTLVCSPIVGGLVWRALDRRQVIAAALLLGALAGAVAATWFWAAVSNPACGFGPARQPAEWVLPSTVLGVVIGGGLAVSVLVARAASRSGPPWRAVLGGAVEVAFLVAALAVMIVVISGPGCQRPPLPS